MTYLKEATFVTTIVVCTVYDQVIKEERVDNMFILLFILRC